MIKRQMEVFDVACSSENKRKIKHGVQLCACVFRCTVQGSIGPLVQYSTRSRCYTFHISRVFLVFLVTVFR